MSMFTKWILKENSLKTNNTIVRSDLISRQSSYTGPEWPHIKQKPL